MQPAKVLLKTLQVVPGASHYDLYDQPAAMGKALE